MASFPTLHTIPGRHQPMSLQRLFLALLITLPALPAMTLAKEQYFGTGQGAGDPQSAVAAPAGSKGMTLADVLTLERRAGIWWSYARDSAEITSRLTDTNARSTLLVPVDSVMLKLARKPHIPPAGEVGIQSEDVLDKFLKSHIVPGIMSAPTNGSVQTLAEGVQIGVSGNRDAGWVVAPGGVPIIEFKEVTNGRVFLLDGIVEGSMAADVQTRQQGRLV